jgi:hypothetical protein
MLTVPRIPRRVQMIRRAFALVTMAVVGGGACNAPAHVESVAAEPPVWQSAQALQGENLAGANLAGANLAGANLAGANLAGANMGGNNLAGANLAGANLAGANLAGANLGGNNLAGANLAGANLAGANLAGANLAGANMAGMDLGQSNLSGSSVAGAYPTGNPLPAALNANTLSGTSSGSNIHALGSANGMLWSGEDLWSTAPSRCIVMGLGSTAFSKLLGQQTANATMNVALGKLAWGFAPEGSSTMALSAWEAVIWGDKTYCSFIITAPTSTNWAGVAGFVKAVFRWQAPPTQTMKISGIDASSVYDSTVKTTIDTYTGMMNAAAQFRAGKVSDYNMLAGELAFITATTNNQSVMVDFSAWVMDSTKTGLVLGNVDSVNPPTRAESVYYVVDNGDGTVSVRIAAANSAGTTVVDTYDELNNQWRAFQKNNPVTAKPVPLRCGGALFLNYYDGEPVPAGKCDDGLTWANASSTTNSRKWSTVAGTTSPHNQYMLLPADATHPLLRGRTADDLKPVISETYVHTFDTASTNASGMTIIDDTQFSYFVSGTNKGWNHSTSCLEAFSSTSSNSPSVGNYTTVSFTGTTVQLYGVTDNSHGIGGISIDGGAEVSADFYSATRRGYQLVFTKTGLSNASHTMKIRVTGNKNALSSGVCIVVDAIVATTAGTCAPEPDVSFCYRQAKNCGSVTALDNCGNTRTVDSCGTCTDPQTCGGSDIENVCGNGTIVDDEVAGTANNQLNYVGANWIHENYTGFGSLYNATRAYTNTTGESVTMKFLGTQFKYYAMKGQRHGIAGVKIDSGSEVMVDLYNPSYIGDQLVYTSPLLSFGTHTVTIRETGTHNALSAGYTLTVDRMGVMDTWSDADVGAVGAAGSVSEVSGGLSVKGSGADVYGSADEFHFVYQNVTGDATVTARVASLTNTNAWSKAMVMMRDGTGAGAPYASALLSPTSTNGYRMQYRTTSGGSTTSVAGPASAVPAYLRVTRSGSSFSTFYSTDGATFTQIGTAQTITMGNTITVGIGVTAHADGSVATGVFDNISIAAGAAGGGGSTSGGSTTTATCGFTVNKNSYDGPTYWGTMTFTNNGSASASHYKVEFDVPSGKHCTNDSVPAGVTLSPLTGSGASAYTSSNHCVYTWGSSAMPLAAGASWTFYYSTDSTTSFDSKASTVVHDSVCNP